MFAKDGKSSNTIMTMITEGDLITRYYTDCPKTEPVRINYKYKTGQILIFRPMKSLSCSIFNIQCFMPLIYFHLICKSFQLNLQWAVLHVCDIFLSSPLQKFPHTWPSNCSTILDVHSSFATGIHKLWEFQWKDERMIWSFCCTTGLTVTVHMYYTAAVHISKQMKNRVCST